MEIPTHPLTTKHIIQTPGDEPPLGAALWALGGFILFAVIIFALVMYGHFWSG